MDLIHSFTFSQPTSDYFMKVAEEQEEWKSIKIFVLKLLSIQMDVGSHGLEESGLETTQVSVLPPASYHKSKKLRESNQAIRKSV